MHCQNSKIVLFNATSTLSWPINDQLPHGDVEVIAGAEQLLHLVVLLVALHEILNDRVAVGRVKMGVERSMHGGKLLSKISENFHFK